MTDGVKAPSFSSAGVGTMFKNNTRFALIILSVLISSLASTAQAAPIYADSLVATSGTTAIDSGNVLGAPDRTGLYFGNPAIPGAYVEVGFSSPVADGPGTDFHIFDIEPVPIDTTETIDVFASNDGNTYTFIGSANGGGDSSQGLIDINGLFTAPISFLRIVQTSTADAYDLDAVGAFYLAPVPLPASLWLFGSGLATLLLSLRRKKSS